MDIQREIIEATEREVSQFMNILVKQEFEKALGDLVTKAAILLDATLRRRLAAALPLIRSSVESELRGRIESELLSTALVAGPKITRKHSVAEISEEDLWILQAIRRLEGASDFSGVTNHELAAELGLGETTARNRAKALVKKGLLKVENQGKMKVYREA